MKIELIIVMLMVAAFAITATVVLSSNSNQEITLEESTNQDAVEWFRSGSIEGYNDWFRSEQ